MTLYVRPSPGRVILDPDSGFVPVPEDGMDVPRTPFWLRAVERGDLIASEPSPPIPPSKPARSRAASAEGDA